MGALNAGQQPGRAGKHEVGPGSSEGGPDSSEGGLRVEFSRTSGSQGNSSLSIGPCPGDVLTGLSATNILQSTLQTANPVLWQFPLFSYESQELAMLFTTQIPSGDHGEIWQGRDLEAGRQKEGKRGGWEARSKTTVTFILTM